MTRRQRRPKIRKPSEDTARFLVGLAAVTRIIRARERLSQAELARRAGVGRNFIAAVENRRANPSVIHMGQLAEGLGLAGAAELAMRAEEAVCRIAASTTRPAP